MYYFEVHDFVHVHFIIDMHILFSYYHNIIITDTPLSRKVFIHTIKILIWYNYTLYPMAYCLFNELRGQGIPLHCIV